MNPLAKMVAHPWAALLAWLLMAAMVAANAFAVAGLRDAAAERARLACDGARDTRQLFATFVDEIAGFLPDQRAAQQFRADTLLDMRQPPYQCVGVPPEG